MGLSKATMEYYEVDYLDEAYDTFWREHDKLLTDVVALRNSFAPDEKTDLCGFSDSDDEDIDEDNRDCLHMMRVCKKWDADVTVFLDATKRQYLPMIITLFMATPKTDWFRANPPHQADFPHSLQEFRTANLRQLFQPLILCRNQGQISVPARSRTLN